MAVVPQGTTAPFTATSGTGTWNGAGNTGTINASNRAVLTWGTTAQGDATTVTNFNIGAGETYNFVLPSGGAVLNRVTAGTNTTNSAFNGLGAAAAVINGTLLSNGQVVVLANGNIIVGSGAQISTASGLVLSTLAENDFSFTATGNLALNGTSQGNIFLGTGTGVASVIGNLSAYAGAITANNLTVSGDLVLNQTGSTTGLALTTAAPTTVGGNLSVTTNNGSITQGAGALTVANGSTVLNSGTGAITLGTATNDFKNVAVTTNGTTGAVTLNDANIITLDASTIGQDLSVTAVGVGGNTAISTSGAVNVGGNASFTSQTDNSNINIGNNSSVGTSGTGALHLVAQNSTVTFNGVGNLTLGNSTVTGVSVAAGGRSAATITTNGVLTIGNTVSVIAAGSTNGSVTLNGGSIVQNANVTSASGNGTITLNATAGNLTVGNITNSGTGGISLRTAGGNISQNAGTVLTTSNTTGTSTINATTGTVLLNNANAFAAGTTIQTTAGAATINNTGTSGLLVIGTTNVTGNFTVNNNAGNNGVQLGQGSGTASQNITVGGNLTVTTAGTGTITDNDFTAFNVFGGLVLTTAGGAVTLDAATANGGLSPSVRFGQVKINAGTGAATVAETTTLNLGNITAASLTATSVSGDIINSGDLNVTGTASFAAGSNGTSMITNGTNNIGTVNFAGRGGSITVAAPVILGATTNVTSGDLVITSTNGGAITLGAASIAGNLTANSSGTITTAAGTGTSLAGQSNTTVGGDLFLIAADSGASSITEAANGRFVVTGNTNIASAGNVTLNQANDFVGNVVLNQAGSTGNVQLFDVNNITVSGVAGGAVEVRSGSPAAASIDAPWNVVLGNLNVASLNATAVNGGGGNSGTVTQAAGTSIHSEGLLKAVTNNANIVITNNGNSAGRVEFYTNGGTNNGTGTISYTEDGTIRLGAAASNSNITLRSNFGSIIEDNNSPVTINARATLNATAPNGSINIGGTTNGATTTANVSTFIASAPSGSVVVLSNNSITLGAINANSLSVSATNNVTQSAALNIFGTASFASTNTTAGRNITLTNAANNFGPVSVALSNNTGTISVTESNTLNLRKVTMDGGGNATFTATSINGDIIDTGLGGVRLGGNSTTAGSGTVSLTASNGNIVIDDPTSDFATSTGVQFNAKDVTLSVLGSSGSTLTLGSQAGPSQASGNLTVSSALGSIANAGTFTVSGNAFFQAPNGSIVINQPGVGFGTLRFIGQQVSISEAGNMDIVTGSASFGPANLVSGGNISIVNAGGVVTFGSTVNLTATGNITLPKLVQAAGLLTVRHTGTANLGALSIAGDLGNITPVDAGTGTYVAPQP